MASAYPAEVAAVVRSPSPAGGEALRTLRATLEPQGLIPMVKARARARRRAGSSPTCAARCAGAVALLREAGEVSPHRLARTGAVAVVNAVNHSGHVFDHAVGDLELARESSTSMPTVAASTPFPDALAIARRSSL